MPSTPSPRSTGSSTTPRWQAAARSSRPTRRAPGCARSSASPARRRTVPAASPVAHLAQLRGDRDPGERGGCAARPRPRLRGRPLHAGREPRTAAPSRSVRWAGSRTRPPPSIPPRARSTSPRTPPARTACSTAGRRPPVSGPAAEHCGGSARPTGCSPRCAARTARAGRSTICRAPPRSARATPSNGSRWTTGRLASGRRARSSATATSPAHGSWRGRGGAPTPTGGQGPTS